MFSWRGCDIPITFTDRQYQRTKAKLVSSLNPVPGYVSPPPPSPNLIDVLCFHGLVSLGIDTSILCNWNRTLTFSNKRWTFQREIYIYITSFKLIRTIGRWPISARATNENNIKPPPRLNLITIILALWRGRKLNCKRICFECDNTERKGISGVSYQWCQLQETGEIRVQFSGRYFCNCFCLLIRGYVTIIRENWDEIIFQRMVDKWLMILKKSWKKEWYAWCNF